MTVSCGIAEVKNFDNPYLDIERADKYLYIAKRTGKNKCICEDKAVDLVGDSSNVARR
jgi:PleD family two-component response regulator